MADEQKPRRAVGLSYEHGVDDKPFVVTRGEGVAAEEILARAYTEVRRVAGDYPASGIRALPWVLAVVARA